ncbi:10870_t:CDS:1, partial [Acaulospora morrowiae]
TPNTPTHQVEMPSHYVYAFFLILCAPITLLIFASFTSMAIITSALATLAIAVRLGFLAIEFSGGVALDFIRWGLKKLVTDSYQVKKVKSSRSKSHNHESSNTKLSSQEKKHHKTSHNAHHKNNNTKHHSKTFNESEPA